MSDNARLVSEITLAKRYLSLTAAGRCWATVGLLLWYVHNNYATSPHSPAILLYLHTVLSEIGCTLSVEERGILYYIPSKKNALMWIR